MFVFFVHREPDIDHITPVVYGLSNKFNNCKIFIICYDTRHMINSDYRFQFLMKKSNVYICYWHEINILSRIIFTPILLLARLSKDKYREKLEAKLFKLPFNKFLFKSFFIKNNIKILTFDHAAPNHFYYMTEVAKGRNIKIVMIPTGVNILHSGEIKDTAISQKYNGIKIIEYPELQENENINTNEQIKRMGCPRYCKEWQNINSSLLDSLESKYPLPNVKDLKVVIFGFDVVNFGLTHSTVQRVLQQKNICVIFKDKPRLFKKGSYNNYPSSLLIKWSDVVICSVSSVILDVIYYNKIFLYPRYIAPKNFWGKFELYNACWKVDSENELIDALLHLKINRKLTNYNNSDAIKFYEHSVYKSCAEDDVLGEYINLYHQMSS